MKRLLMFMIVVFFISLIAYFFTDKYIREVFSVISVNECEKILSNCMDEAMTEAMGSGILYEELIFIKQDEAGNIVMVESNTVKMNAVAGDAVKRAEEKLLEKQKSGLKVPFGYIFGGQLFGEALPGVKVNFRQIGNITASFSSEFSEAGINQVKHTVNLTLNAEALVMIPGNNTKVYTEVTFPVCDIIIIGKVPDGYMDFYNRNINP